jgi:hypothetical protein
MTEQSIDEEQLPTTIVKNNCLNGAETPPRGSRCSAISGSNPSAMYAYVEARYPHDHDNLVDSLVQKTTPSEDYRNKEQIVPESLLSDLKLHLDKKMAELKDQNKRDFEKSKYKNTSNREPQSTVVPS